jgi:hypothetical protein
MEVARVTWEQVHQGLASGSIFLQSSATKTKQSRVVPICDSLRQWLLRYSRASGLVLPVQWQAEDEMDQIYRLNDLTQYVARKANLDWKPNGPRHSFCTYRIKLTGDPAGVADEMGTSMAKIEKHYRSRSNAVTVESAKEWFKPVVDTCLIFVGCTPKPLQHEPFCNTNDHHFLSKFVPGVHGIRGIACSGLWCQPWRDFLREVEWQRRALRR